jgi:hypothetical protein
VLFSARAFLAVQGALVSNEDIIRKRIGNAVVRGFYPASVGYYALGPVNKYRISRLPKASAKADLLLPLQADQVQANIGQFLKTTRDQRLRALRNTIQNNPKTALRSDRTGEILQKLSTDQYRKLAKQIGYTTYFDMLSRLRIAATNPSAAPREIERFVDADVDVRLFHQSLVNIVSHLNAVHECYVAKALGLDAYKALIARQPTYLQDSFVRDRLQTVVKPMLSAETREPMAIAASWRLAA